MSPYKIDNNLTGGKMFPYLIEEKERKKSSSANSPKRSFTEEKTTEHYGGKYTARSLSPKYPSRYLDIK